jgi:hypothetical protein
MELRPEDYLNINQDARGFRDLKRRLRQHPEEERFRFICQIIPERRGLGLRLANSCLRSRRFFEELLMEGMRTGDASSMRTWLKCVVPRLGVVRVLAALRAGMDSNPDAVDNALYWMPPDGSPGLFLASGICS